jgi:Rieske Fe-S protein
MSRRIFLKTAVLTGCAALVTGVPLATYAIFPSLKERVGNWIDVGPVKDLEPDNFNMLSYKFLLKDGWIILPQSGFVWARADAKQKIKIFSSTCSHLACNVIWQEETQEFVCPCHSGRFNADGQPIAGPPSRPLSVLDHKVKDDNLQVYMKV